MQTIMDSPERRATTDKRSLSSRVDNQFPITRYSTFTNSPRHHRALLQPFDEIGNMQEVYCDCSETNQSTERDDYKETHDCDETVQNRTQCDHDIDVPQTFVRAEAPRHLLGAATTNSAHGVLIDMTLRSVVCSGGGLLEGDLLFSFDAAAKKNLMTQISSIELDCLGVEMVKGHLPNMFFAIAQDLLHHTVDLYSITKIYVQDDHIRPGNCVIPFELQLPLDVGPGHFSSKEAEINYTLFITVNLSNSKKFTKGRKLIISRKVKLFPCLDPEKTFHPSAAPIEAAEEGKVRFGGKQTLKVAARLNRACWIAGQKAFVDVSITNDSTKTIKRVQLDLIRCIAYYRSAAAVSAFQAVDQRLPERTDAKTIATSLLTVESEKSENTEWKGIKAGSRESTMCQIDIPAGELSVSAGRYFGTQYMVRIFVGPKGSHVSLELPIVIFHMNSLDVMPSSLEAVTQMIAAYVPFDRPGESTSSAEPRVPLPHLVNTTEAQSPKRLGNTPQQRLGALYDSPPRLEAKVTCSRRNTMSAVCQERPGGQQSSPNIALQTDLRRALSLDYQSRFKKLDLSPENAGYTRGVPLETGVQERKHRSRPENLAHRLNRQRNCTPNFADVV